MHPRLLAMGLLFALTLVFAACSGDSTETSPIEPETVQPTAEIRPDPATAVSEPTAMATPALTAAPIRPQTPEHADPEPTAVATPAPTLAPTPIALSTPTQTPAPAEPEEPAEIDPTKPTVQDAREYLTEVVPACSPVEGTSINPCDEKGIAPFGWFHPGGGISIWNLPEPVSIRTFLDGGLPSFANPPGRARNLHRRFGTLHIGTVPATKFS